MSAVRGRRRSRPSLAARLRVFWLVGVVAAGALVWLSWTLATLPAFKLKSVSITGLERVSRADVVARAHIDPAANVWLLDRSAIRRRIEALPYVATASVHVRPLANVWIEIDERRADACLRDGRGRAVTIDRDSRILENGCAETPGVTYAVRATVAAQPGAFLHEAELAMLQRDARALAAGGDRFSTFAHDEYGQLEATMHDGITVQFGADGDLESKQRLIEPILAQLGPHARDVRAVDLRAPRMPVVQYRR